MKYSTNSANIFEYLYSTSIWFRSHSLLIRQPQHCSWQRPGSSLKVRTVKCFILSLLCESRVPKEVCQAFLHHILFISQTNEAPRSAAVFPCLTEANISPLLFKFSSAMFYFAPQLFPRVDKATKEVIRSPLISDCRYFLRVRPPTRPGEFLLPRLQVSHDWEERLSRAAIWKDWALANKGYASDTFAPQRVGCRRNSSWPPSQTYHKGLNRWC